MLETILKSLVASKSGPTRWLCLTVRAFGAGTAGGGAAESRVDQSIISRLPKALRARPKSDFLHPLVLQLSCWQRPQDKLRAFCLLLSLKRSRRQVGASCELLPQVMQNVGFGSPVRGVTSRKSLPSAGPNTLSRMVWNRGAVNTLAWDARNRMANAMSLLTVSWLMISGRAVSVKWGMGRPALWAASVSLRTSMPQVSMNNFALLARREANWITPLLRPLMNFLMTKAWFGTINASKGVGVSEAWGTLLHALASMHEGLRAGLLGSSGWQLQGLKPP